MKTTNFKNLIFTLILAGLSINLAIASEGGADGAGNGGSSKADQDALALEQAAQTRPVKDSDSIWSLENKTMVITKDIVFPLKKESSDPDFVNLVQNDTIGCGFNIGYESTSASDIKISKGKKLKVVRVDSLGGPFNSVSRVASYESAISSLHIDFCKIDELYHRNGCADKAIERIEITKVGFVRRHGEALPDLTVGELKQCLRDVVEFEPSELVKK
jgi:hypothetical protein